MNHFLKACVAAVCLFTGLLLNGCNGSTDLALREIGKDGDKGFMFKTLTRGDHVRKYGLFIPLDYNPTHKYPVIIFLQGIGEGAGFGQGDGKNMTVGLGPFVAKAEQSGSNFPFIVIFPQSSGGWSADSVYAQDVITALDDVSKAYSVDQDRVSLTGLSTGGYGTYVIGAKYHDRFAALVPMGSNGSDTSVAPQLKDVAVRAYCSASGDIFAGSNDQNMVNAINAQGGNAEFIQTDTVGHDCWEAVYGSGELFTWLESQRRHSAGRAHNPSPAPSPKAMAPTPAASHAAATPAASPNVRATAPASVNTPY